MKSSLRLRASAAFSAAALLLTWPTASHAEPADTGPVTEYLFTQSSGATVANTAPGATLGAAEVQNLQAADWTGTSLRLRGGSKTSAGDWVRLPDGILAGARSATVTAEVKPTAAMLNSFHFLWNVGNASSDTEYFFASLNCGNGRNPLVGLKTAGSEQLAQASSCGLQANQWVSVTSVIDGDAGTASLYLNGIRVAQSAVSATPGDVRDQTLNTIGRSPWPDPLFAGAVSAFRVWDRALSGGEIAAVADADAQLNDAELRAAAAAVLAGLGLQDVTTSTHLDLATAGGRVTWSSADPALVGADGTVTPPLAGEEPRQTTLTATAQVRGRSATQTITVTVLPSSETAEQRVARLAEQWVLEPVVASGYLLPTAPAGTRVQVSDVQGATLADGQLTGAGTATLTAVVTDLESGASVTKVFSVTILAASDAHRLLAYHRNPTSVTEANNADIALSMHLALANDDAWEPLNGNYGIFFAKTSQTPPAGGTTEQILRSLRDPHLFRLADGNFGVVATRTARGGGSDGTQTSSVLFARSADLATYTEVGMVNLGVNGGVNDPAAVWDDAAGHYVVSWTSDAGAPMYVTFGDLADASTRGEPRRGVIASSSVDEAAVANFASGNTIVVNAEVAAALEVRFGRIRNTTVAELPAVTVETGGAVVAGDLPRQVTLGYSDGSTANRAVLWDQDDLAAIDTSRPGRYQVEGTVKQVEYPTPFADERADPTIFKFDWNGTTKFLMIATEDLNMNPIDPANGPHMPFRVADRVEDLSDEALRAGRTQEVDLLRQGDTGAYGNAMTGCFWAPEIHVINGRLSILFMPCYNGTNGRPDMWTGRASIIQLKQDSDGKDLDPAVPANWSKAQHVTRADGSILNSVQRISLDMTYFQDSGQSYYAWQMLGSVFIARMDPNDPTRITSDPVRIIVPEYAWDNAIAEGPNVHVRDGRLYMIYSGSTVGDSYTTGLVTADAGQGVDLTDPAAWEKLNQPIQKSGIFNGAWQLGTGHGMWSFDEDGNLLYVFHARTDHLGLSGRDMFVRRVHWASDGLPVLDMETDEEVAPENRRVSVTIDVVGEPIGPRLEVSADARCVAGKVVWTVQAKNLEAAAVNVTLTGPYGSKSVEALAPGRNASHVFSTRAKSLAEGTTTVTGTLDGTTSTQEARHQALTCS